MATRIFCALLLFGFFGLFLFFDLDCLELNHVNKLAVSEDLSILVVLVEVGVFRVLLQVQINVFLFFKVVFGEDVEHSLLLVVVYEELSLVVNEGEVLFESSGKTLLGVDGSWLGTVEASAELLEEEFARVIDEFEEEGSVDGEALFCGRKLKNLDIVKVKAVVDLVGNGLEVEYLFIERVNQFLDK